jgi:hypothetical protein
MTDEPAVYVFDTAYKPTGKLFELRSNGEVVVAIYGDGRLEIPGPPDEAAMFFWDTIRKLARNSCP